MFDAAATWVTCKPSVPAAVSFVKTSKNANADAQAILKPMPGIGSLRLVCEDRDSTVCDCMISPLTDRSLLLPAKAQWRGSPLRISVFFDFAAECRITFDAHLLFCLKRAAAPTTTYPKTARPSSYDPRSVPRRVNQYCTMPALANAKVTR